MTLRRYRRLDPERRRPIPPLAIITAAGTAGIELWTPDGGLRTYDPGEQSRRALADLPGWRILALPSINTIVTALDGRYGTLYAFRRSLIGFKPDDGPKIVGTRRVFRGVPTGDAIAEIATLDGWCRDLRVRLSTIGWTGEQIWRRTLDRDLMIASPTGRRGVVGGRKECPNPQLWSDMLAVDLRAAYPAAMMAEAYPTRIHRVDPSKALNPGVIGVASARVTIPESSSPWVPIHLPTTTGPWWSPGEGAGWWTLRELRAAVAAGVKVEIVDAFAGSGWRRPFDGWGELVREVRSISPRYGKAIANGLWGIFSMEGETVEYRSPDPDGLRIGTELRRRSAPPPTAGVWAADTSARVRVRLWAELIEPCDPVFVDTDGGVIRAGSPLPIPTGGGFGEWQVRDRYRQFEARAAQAYRAVRWENDQEIIKVAGLANPTRADLRSGRGVESLATGRYGRDNAQVLRHLGSGQTIRLAHATNAPSEGWAIETSPLPPNIM